MSFQQVIQRLRRDGLLMESDPLLPSVASIVAGAPVKGSWWSHPAGRAIFAAISQLADRPDALSLKLVSRKVTWVHRALWPDLFAALSARETWQMRGLPAGARALLARLDRAGVLAPEDIPPAARAAAKLLEQRLLALPTQVHTATGAHRMQLESWMHRAARARLRGRSPTSAAGKEKLEQTLRRLNEAPDDHAAHAAHATLPWS